MISVVLATYGDWCERHPKFLRQALTSAMQQSNSCTEVIRVHGKTLHDARNEGAKQASGSRLVFLDGDDWLSPYFTRLIVESETVLQPLTRYWYEEGPPGPVDYITPRASLSEGNHLIVGCPVDKELFMDVGGFDDWPIYEDWALWLKMDRAGATFGKTSGVYNIRVRQDGRNSSDFAGRVYQEIRKRYS